MSRKIMGLNCGKILGCAIGASVVVTTLTSCKKWFNDLSQIKDSWDQKNDPGNFDPRFDYRFATLPLKGRLASEPWSDSYWQENMGGIGIRWVAGRPVQDVWSYSPPTPPTLGAVKKMTTTDIMYLSAAEKFDIYMGRFDYPTVDYARRRNRKIDPDGTLTPDWKGICPAWAVASLYFAEPKPVMPKSPQGIEVPFGTSDIKGLLAVARDLTGLRNPRYAGYRCEVVDPKFNQVSSKAPCNGMNAGSFHVLLANLVRPDKNGFVIDRDAGYQVWNQPVFAFETTVLSEQQGSSSGAAPGTVKEIHVKSKVSYTLEKKPSWFPHLSKGTNYHETAEYLYRLELDAQGRILGGMWEGTLRPDFAWMQDKPEIRGEVSEMWLDAKTKIGVNRISLDGINQLYQQSMQ